MNKTTGFLVIGLVMILCVNGSLSSDVFHDRGRIKRLTYSGNNAVHFPCLSDDGQRMLYILETKNGTESTRSIRTMIIDTGEETELYHDRQWTAPEPYEETPLLVGSKPPLLSGNGEVAFFVLSLDRPEKITDHYLAMIKTDGAGSKIIPFPIEDLREKDWNALDFAGDEWERISHYAANTDGSRVACVMKGHLGPVRYGNASAIILLDTQSGRQRTVLAPEFNGEEWSWTSHPSRPLQGGGWAFDMSGSGGQILFGAQSSDDSLDYDLYLADWEGTRVNKITDFHDRWFSLGELTRDGKAVVFFYTGKKKQGIGTYVVESEGWESVFLKSRFSGKVEYTDMSGDGRYVLFKHIYDGILLDRETNTEEVIFNPNTAGYVSGLVPMDLPQFPAFWRPRIMDHGGDRILLAGLPDGKQSPEIYLLSFESDKQ